MALNLSRGNYQEKYSSDRISSLLGNGLLVFINKKTNFNNILSNKEVVYYTNFNDLIKKIRYYAKNDNERIKIAKLGHKKYHEHMSNIVVTKYIMSCLVLKIIRNHFGIQFRLTMFSILIPTFNNLEYLKLCIKSLNKNSYFKNQIICHVNIGDDGTVDFLNQNNINYSITSYNSGICEGINKASKKSKFDYFLYAHDDFYFCPNWDLILAKEINKIEHNNFYLSGTMMNEGQIKYNCGETPNEFNETQFLKEYKSFNHYDFQGSTWAPSVVHRYWDKVGGLVKNTFLEVVLILISI